jgi:hypothetical protein
MLVVIVVIAVVGVVAGESNSTVIFVMNGKENGGSKDKRDREKLDGELEKGQELIQTQYRTWKISGREKTEKESHVNGEGTYDIGI